MTLQNKINTAKDAISKALISALENKNETATSALMDCYNTLNNIKIEESFNFNKFTISSNNIPCSYYNDDYVNFGAAGPTTIGGAWGNDTISFSLG